MPVSRALAIHVSNYTIASVLVTLASVVSFPILTRLMTVADYGVMNLIASALALLVGLAKLGVGNSALRFYSEVKAGKHGVSIAAYASTVVFGMGGVGFIVTMIWAVVSFWMSEVWWNEPGIGKLMLVTSPLILVRVLESAFLNQLRAQEKSGVIAVYGVLRRYVSLAVLLAVLFFVAKNLWGFYLATLLTETLATAMLALAMLRNIMIRPGLFSVQLFRQMLAFGIPMAGYELSGQVLAMGDRYVIETLLGAEPLGIYSAAYNLCEYVKIVCFSSFVTAVIPAYSRIWETRGTDETLLFLDRFLHIYVMFSMVAIGVTASVSSEILALLASEKYRSGAAIVSYVVAGMSIDGVVMISGAGLYLQKRSKTIMLLVAVTAAFNIGLNYLLVPKQGIVGSAIATLASYAVLWGLFAAFGYHRLPVRPPWRAVLKFAAIGSIMYVAVSVIRFERDLLTMVVRIAVGPLLYFGLCALLDNQFRAATRNAWTRVGGRRRAD